MRAISLPSASNLDRGSTQPGTFLRWALIAFNDEYGLEEEEEEERRQGLIPLERLKRSFFFQI
jgi:hypothetical protein